MYRRERSEQILIRGCVTLRRIRCGVREGVIEEFKDMFERKRLCEELEVLEKDSDVSTIGIDYNVPNQNITGAVWR